MAWIDNSGLLSFIPFFHLGSPIAFIVKKKSLQMLFLAEKHWCNIRKMQGHFLCLIFWPSVNNKFVQGKASIASILQFYMDSSVYL